MMTVPQTQTENSLTENITMMMMPNMIVLMTVSQADRKYDDDEDGDDETVFQAVHNITLRKEDYVIIWL